MASHTSDSQRRSAPKPSEPIVQINDEQDLSLGTGSATSPGGAGRARAPQGEGENFPALLPDFTGSTAHSPSPVIQDPEAGNVLHKVQALLSPQMTPADVAATDLLAAIFDGIFDDAALPVSVKALLGRLQIPALKVAVRDPEFFKSASHPLRLLIERIATLGKEQGTTLTDNDAFYKLLAQTVQFVQAENATEAGVLEGALIRLNTSVILELWSLQIRGTNIHNFIFLDATRRANFSNVTSGFANQRTRDRRRE